MPRRPLHRLATLLAMVSSLLFSQLALAAYICPQQRMDAEAMVAMVAAGLPCEGMDAQQPVLCHQVAADPGQNFEAAKLPALSLPAIIQVLKLPLAIEQPADLPVPLAAEAESRPPPDPLFLSTLRLRV
jgi:hypothetical protein